jgi:glycosyltransferase involved in cell wall biosynthesis
MKILFDHQIFTMQKYGGISQYVAELYKRLPKGHAFVSMRYSRNEYLNRAGGLTYPIVELPTQKYLEMAGYYLIEYLNRRNTIHNLKYFDSDVFHPTYYDPYFLKHLRGKPYVLTIHDLAHERYPEQFGDAAMVIRNKQRVIENASQIIAISQATKDDILRVYDIDPDLITVIHLATSLTQVTTTIPGGFPKKYILFVGSRGTRYKGFEEFMDTMAPMMEEEKDLWVLCAGGGPFTDKECSQIPSNLLPRFHQVMFRGNDELACLYQYAEAFVFPSWIEGFGIPQLEAMTCGCPMACSDIPVFHEVAGYTAEYFEAGNTGSMCEAIIRARKNKLMGKERAREFSWDKMAKQTIEVYERCL